MITFREKLKYLRLKSGLTQRRLGMAVGFPESQAEIRIDQYESGSRKPGMNITLKLADALGVSPDILMVPVLTEPWEYNAEDFWTKRLTDVRRQLPPKPLSFTEQKGEKTNYDI